MKDAPKPTLIEVIAALHRLEAKRIRQENPDHLLDRADDARNRKREEQS